MTFPTDPEERKKLIIALVLGLAAFLYALNVAVIKPLSSTSVRTQKEIEENTEAIQATRAYLSQTAENRREQFAEIEKILPAVDQPAFVIKPRFGNYELPVQEVIQHVSRVAGIPDPVIRAGGAPKPMTPPLESGVLQVLYAYPSAVSFSSDLEKALSFLHILQNENPYCVISRITISAVPQKPLEHAVTFQIEWPVWSDNNALDRMRSVITNAVGGVSGRGN